MTGKKLILDTTLKAIADAIRTKTGKSAKMTPAGMVTEIGRLTLPPSGTKYVVTAENGTKREDVKAYETVEIQTNVSANLTPLTATENRTYNPGYGFDGFSEVVVNVQGGSGDTAPVVILAQTGPKAAQSATAKTNGSTRPTSLAGLFSGWESLESADLSGLETGNVTDISYMFSSCGALQSLNGIILPANGFPAVQNAQGLFSGSGLTAINPTAFISTAEDISYMADYNASLTQVTFGAGCLRNVLKADGMFCQCEQLQALDFSNTELRSVEHMASAFSGCSALVTVNFSGCNFSNITNDPDEGTGWDRLFEGCSALENIQTDQTTQFPGCDIDLSATEVLTAQSVQNVYNALPQSQAGYTLSLHKTVYDSTDPNLISMIENKGWTVKSVDPDEENW